MSDIRIRTNLPDVRGQMRAFGLDFERRAVRSATNAAAQVIKRLATQGAPVLRNPRPDRVAGTLKRAIYVVRDRRAGRGLERYSIGARTGRKAAATGRDAFYWRFLEGGWIPRGSGQRIAGGQRRRALERSRLLARGSRRLVFPFLAPAFSAGQGAALNAFYAKIEQRIAKENATRTPR